MEICIHKPIYDIENSLREIEEKLETAIRESGVFPITIPYSCNLEISIYTPSFNTSPLTKQINFEKIKVKLFI